MKMSISNIAWEAKDDEYVISRLPSYGFKGLEIAPTRIIPELPYHHLPEAKEFASWAKSKADLDICSMQSIWYRRTESIFGTESEVDSLIEYTKEAITFAEAIGCPNLVFGCPKNRIIPEGRTVSDSEDFFRTIGDFAAEHGTTIALEAVPVSYGTNFLNRTSDLFNFVTKIGSPGLKMNLDFGTMLVNGEKADSVGEYVPVVNHVHISEDALECIEKRHEHEVFLNTLKKAGYDRFVSIEMKNQGDPDKVMTVVSYLKELFDSQQL